jgi:hypothetical protein
LGIILKLGFIVFAVTAAFCTNAFAFKCNTVMGGCPADTTQVTASHMRSEIVNKADSQKNTPNNKAAVAPTATEKASAQNKLPKK